jgi:hypothetical protein
MQVAGCPTRRDAICASGLAVSHLANQDEIGGGHSGL